MIGHWARPAPSGLFAPSGIFFALGTHDRAARMSGRNSHGFANEAPFAMDDMYYQGKRLAALQIFHTHSLIHSPFFNEDIALTSQGFRHLCHSTHGVRTKEEQIHRFNPAPPRRPCSGNRHDRPGLPGAADRSQPSGQHWPEGSDDDSKLGLYCPFRESGRHVAGRREKGRRRYTPILERHAGTRKTNTRRTLTYAWDPYMVFFLRIGFVRHPAPSCPTVPTHRESRDDVPSEGTPSGPQTAS